MQSPVYSCPHCSSIETAPFLFGFPSALDMPSRWHYGGPEITSDSPTHACSSCGNTWILEDSLREPFPFPRECHFCNDEMNAKDQFLYNAEFESWVDQEESLFMLESGTFSDFPFPTCRECREGIHENQEALRSEMHKEEKMRVVEGRFLIAGFICFVLIVVLSLIFGKK